MLDYTDLIRDIENLETNLLIELNQKYFANKSENYTDEIVLNLVFKHLLVNYSNIKPNYNDDFGTLDTNKKLLINEINSRITTEINKGLDYVCVVSEADHESELINNLRELIVNDLYKGIILKHLLSKVSKSEVENKSVEELHDLCRAHELDFNKIIFDLYNDLENKIDIKDYNSMQISWIVIAFFFEICDIGVKK